MTAYDAQLQIVGEESPPLHVVIELDGDRMTLNVGEEQIAEWGREEVRVLALPDGFHLRAEGEEVLLHVEHDAEFALDLGLRNAHPQLRKRMSALMRDDKA